MDAPLLVTRDTDLLDDLLRLSAAAGVTLDVAHDPAAALLQWGTSPLVLVGPDLAASLAGQSPPRRDDVYLLSRGEPDYRAAVAVGAIDVVELPAGEAWLVEVIADAADGGSRTAVSIGFVGGSGGAGASTLAAATATLSAPERPTILLDVDPLGPGVERVLGMETEGVTWETLTGTRGRLGSRALRDSLPKQERLAVLGWGASSPDLDDQSVREVLAAAQRGHDLVVVDLPRNISGSAALVASRCDHVVLVARCSVPGAAAAARVLRGLRRIAPTVHLVARTAGGMVGSHALGEAVGLPVLCEVADQRHLTEQVDLGLGPLRSQRGPLARSARDILAGLVS